MTGHSCEERLEEGTEYADKQHKGASIKASSKGSRPPRLTGTAASVRTSSDLPPPTILTTSRPPSTSHQYDPWGVPSYGAGGPYDKRCPRPPALLLPLAPNTVLATSGGTHAKRRAAVQLVGKSNAITSSALGLAYGIQSWNESGTEPAAVNSWRNYHLAQRRSACIPARACQQCPTCEGDIHRTSCGKH